MLEPGRLIFIHGSDSSSRSDKAVLLSSLFPGMLTPDFNGDLAARMRQLEEILADESGWTIIGSSLGGLMAALFATRHPSQVRKLVLLAPALTLPEFVGQLPGPVSVPTVVIHGRQDEVVPPEQVRLLARKAFTNLTYRLVDDDHRLLKTVRTLNWTDLLS